MYVSTRLSDYARRRSTLRCNKSGMWVWFISCRHCDGLVTGVYIVTTIVTILLPLHVCVPLITPAPCRSFRLSLPCACTFGGQQDSVAVPNKDVRFQCGFGVIGTLAERKRCEVRAVSMTLGALGQGGGVHPLALRVRRVSVMRRIPFRRHRIELDFV